MRDGGSRALTPVVARLAADVADDPETAYRRAQADARAALADLPGDLGPEPERCEPIAAWWCAGCGRMEAPQPCVGVCIRRRDAVTEAGAYQDAVAQAEASRRRARTLAAVVRQAAWATPRDGWWDVSWRSLAGQAITATGSPRDGRGSRAAATARR